MIILGIDPGTATTGYGLIRVQKNRKQKTENRKIKNSQFELIDYGCIVTSKEQEMGERLVQLRKSLKKLLQEQKPNIVCVERHFFGKNSQTAITVAQARGVILETIAACKFKIAEYQGLAVKRELTGDGRADKKVIEKKVLRFLGKRKFKKPVNGFLDDAVDGLALAIYHVSVNS